MFGNINGMIGNYADRLVARYDNDAGDKMISTAAVYDGAHPYETAFKHPEYNGGEMVIVEAYDTKAAAAIGHAKWLSTMVNGPLPDVLNDCDNAEIAQFATRIGVPNTYPRTPR